MKNETFRPLGGLELLFNVWDHNHAKHFLTVAEIEGSTTPESWKKALVILQNRHPMLTMGIEKVNEKELVFIRHDNKQIPLEIIYGAPDSNLIMNLEKELQNNFDASQAPLARVKLYYGDQKCTLVFSIYHSIADGISATFLINDLLKALTGKELEPLPVFPSIDELLKLDNHAIAAKVIDQTKPEFLKKHLVENKNGFPKVALLEFPKELTDQIVLRSKEQNTSVHGTLQTAAAIAILRLSPELNAEVRIASPISTRNNLNIGEQCGCYAIGSVITVKQPENEKFWDLARLAKEDLVPFSSFAYLQGHTANTRAAIQSSDNLIGIIEDNLGFDVMISNLGRYPFPTDYEMLRLTNMYGPMVSGSHKEQVIGVLTINGTLQLTNTSRSIVPGLLELIREIISEQCA